MTLFSLVPYRELSYTLYVMKLLNQNLVISPITFVDKVRMSRPHFTATRNQMGF